MIEAHQGNITGVTFKVLEHGFCKPVINAFALTAFQLDDQRHLAIAKFQKLLERRDAVFRLSNR
ncbi:hypothetical protein D3C87_2205300 [compost metagenome]